MNVSKFSNPTLLAYEGEAKNGSNIFYDQTKNFIKFVTNDSSFPDDWVQNGSTVRDVWTEIKDSKSSLINQNQVVKAGFLCAMVMAFVIPFLGCCWCCLRYYSKRLNYT